MGHNTSMSVYQRIPERPAVYTEISWNEKVIFFTTSFKACYPIPPKYLNFSVGWFKTMDNVVAFRSSHQGCSVRNVFFKISQNSQENTCARVSFLIKLQASAFNFIKKETLAQVFSSEFFEIFKNSFFTEHHLATASVFWQELLSNSIRNPSV